MLSHFKRIFSCIILLTCITISSNAQVSTKTDLTQYKADNFTDADVKELVQRYKFEGYTTDQIGQGMIANGFAAGEWQKLQARIAALESEQGDSASNDDFKRNTNDGIVKEESASSKSLNNQVLLDSYKKKIFGASLFSQTELTFEPNLKLPTPENYQLGPEDDLIIDVYGYAENTLRLTVSPEGFIRIPRVGLVQVSGLTIEQAKKTISKQLSSIYTTIQSGETFVSVALGNIRSIKVVIIGEAHRPGTYTLPSVASIFNALNAAGGPNENGSFRDIKLVRNNKLIAKIDIYDFLLTGELKNNLNLQDQDIIKIEPYIKRIELNGEVKNTGVFEAIDNETFADLVRYAGGFTNNAYKDRVTVLRNTDKERSVADVANEHFSTFVIQNGDLFEVGRILNRFSNMVQIAGAIYRPGVYALEPGMTVKSLITKADNVRDDAFLSRAVIVREQEDRTKEMLSFSVEHLLNGGIADIPLRKGDSIYIASISSLKEEQNVSIWGEVMKEGTYSYSENMTLKDLLFIAGGVKDNAELSKVEVSRLIKDSEVLKLGKQRTKLLEFTLDRNLTFEDVAGEFLLESMDQITVRPISGFELAKRVKIEGEVYYPGSYVMTTKNERISEVLKRAGGLNQFAYAKGAFLIRNKKITLAEQKLDRTIADGISQSDSLINKDAFLKNEGIIGIDLIKIMQNPGSKWDLILEEGDVINIPRQLETVQISGEVFLPVYVRYDKSMTLKDYVSNAGGFAGKALKRKSFVVYANGTAKSTKNFLFFKNYPKVEPGAHIHVPTKPERKGMSTGEVIGITSATTSLAAVVIGLIRTVF